MSTFLITALVFGLVMAGMAVGVIMGRAPIKGSCGGLGAVGVDKACGICGGDATICEEETRKLTSSDSDQPAQYYPADRRS